MIPISGSAERAWSEILASGRSIDGTVRAGQAMLPTGVSSTYARQVYDFACAQITILNRAAAVVGLNDYAKLVTGTPDYDAVASVAATVKALQETINWMRAAWPVDGNGLGVQFAFRPNGGTQDIDFTPESLQTFAPLMQALLETLN